MKMLLSLLCFLCISAQAASVSLVWTQSTSVSVSNKVYWGTSSSPYQNTKQIDAATSYTVTNLLWNTPYFFNVTAISNGVESPFTAEVNTNIVVTLAVSPQGLIVTNGQSIQFYATNTAVGIASDVTTQSFWTSSIPAAVNINRTNGQATAITDGSFRTTISATWSNLTASAIIQITNQPDIYPPKISDVWFIPNPPDFPPLIPHDPIVTWVTDKESNTELETLFCKLPPATVHVIDGTLSISHSVELTGCVRNHMYVRITATGTNGLSSTAVYDAFYAAGAPPEKMCCEPPQLQGNGMLVVH